MKKFNQSTLNALNTYPYDSNYKVNRGIPAFAVYREAEFNLKTQVTDHTITITDNVGPVSFYYIGKSLSQLVNEINSSVLNVTAYRLIDLGAELMTFGALAQHGETSAAYVNYDFVHFNGFAFRYNEDSVIQLKPPTQVSAIDPWFARIGVGTLKTRFLSSSFTSFPGITPNTIYTFSVPEYVNQSWSLRYGLPYKDVIGEAPKVNLYNSVISASVVQTSNFPIYYRNKNISVTIKGVRQPNSIIKYVDENNGLIYLSSKLDHGTPIKIDYTYVETSYLYDAIDLNVSIAHTPANIDSFIAFYIKPSHSTNSLVSGGNTVYHEVVNTALSARTIVAKAIPGTLNTSRPLYEPVFYLGSISVRQAINRDNIDLIDTRSRGGGIKLETNAANWRNSEFFLDLGNIYGVPIPGNAALIINLPDSVKNSGLSREEIRSIASKDISLGIVPIFDSI